ncbi:MAG: hypothetical protein WBF66_07280 [Dehalococcoidia bacterium]
MQQYWVFDVSEQDPTDLEEPVKVRRHALVLAASRVDAASIALGAWYGRYVLEKKCRWREAERGGSLFWGEPGEPPIVFVVADLRYLEYLGLVDEGRFRAGPNALERSLRDFYQKPECDRQADLDYAAAAGSLDPEEDRRWRCIIWTAQEKSMPRVEWGLVEQELRT